MCVCECVFVSVCVCVRARARACGGKGGRLEAVSGRSSEVRSAGRPDRPKDTAVHVEYLRCHPQ